MGYSTRHTLTFPHPKTGETVNLEHGPCLEDLLYDPEEMGDDWEPEEVDPDLEPIYRWMAERDGRPQGSGFGWIQVGESHKWHSRRADMLALSAEFPEILFTLYGEGNSSLDAWYEYYQDGKFQHCAAQITFDEFDPAKLRKPA